MAPARREVRVRLPATACGFSLPPRRLPSKAKLKKCMSIDEKPQSHGRLGESFLLSSVKSFVSKLVDKGKKAVVSGLAAQVIKRIPKQFQTLARAVLPYAIKGDFGGAIKSLKGVARQAVIYPIMLHYLRIDPLAWQCIYVQRIRQVVSPEYFTHTEPINFDLTEELKKEEWSEPPKYDRCPGNSLRKVCKMDCACAHPSPVECTTAISSFPIFPIHHIRRTVR